jgi:hypothetical protein
MPEMSFTEIIGFMGKVIAALGDLRAELAKVGVDVDPIIALVRDFHDRALSLNEKQESLKRETVSTTAQLEAVLKEGYARTSGALDTMIASVGKTGDAAKNLRTIRSDILRPKRGSKDRGTPPA